MVSQWKVTDNKHWSPFRTGKNITEKELVASHWKLGKNKMKGCKRLFTGIILGRQTFLKHYTERLHKEHGRKVKKLKHHFNRHNAYGHATLT